MTKVRQALGRWGEDIAAKYLIEQGMELLDRNWRTHTGEIDIIALDVNALVFFEVKTRRSAAFGSGVEAVTALKSRRLRRLAAAWLAEHAGHGGPVRFDVVSVTPVRRGDPRIEHVKGAF